MTRTCADCGTDLTDADKNAAGHYRDRCESCIRDAVDITPHVEVCDDPECGVCLSHAEEYG